MKRNKGRISIIAIVLVISFIFVYGYFNKPLLSHKLNEINQIVIKNNRTEREITLNIENHLSEISKIFSELKSIETKTVRFTKELDRQESDPYYSLIFYYYDGSTGKIETTESGKFFYRKLGNSDWVGGENQNLYKVLDILIEEYS